MGRRGYGRGRYGRFMRSELGIDELDRRELAAIRQQQEQAVAKSTHDAATGHEAEVRARLVKSPKFKLADGSVDYKKINWFIGKLKREGEIRNNPKRNNPKSYPAMSYAAAHKWEAQARKQGVSKVARSGRGFMRAYQRAGSFAKLPESWKKKRNAFIARHMAQAKSEALWKDGKPSRRALALIMWAYMPPRRNPLALAMSPRKLARINTAKYGRSKALSIARKNLNQAADSYDRAFYTDLVKELGGKVRSNPRRQYIVQVIDRARSTLNRRTWKQASKHIDYANAVVQAYKHLDAGRWVRIVDQHGTVLAGMKSKDGRRLLVQGNPPALLKEHPDFFLRFGQSQEGLKQVRQDIYEKTGRWLPLEEVRQVMQDAQVAYNRNQIRIVK